MWKPEETSSFCLEDLNIGTGYKAALAVEEIHHGLYTQALNAVKSGSDLPDTKIYVCPVCGNTVKDNIPDKCPVCGAAKEQFQEVL